ncbi:MAG: hypothetical protein WCH77_06365 [Planctomycetota bacterium]|jgi:hypothetical protein
MQMSRRILVAAVFLRCASSAGAERIKVIGPPRGQAAAEQLLDSMAAACNRGDFIDFMSHFTPSQGRRIRGRVKDMFIIDQPRVHILQVTLLSDEQDRITCGVRYAWHARNKPAEIVASKVMALKIEGKWKLDGEQLKAIQREPSHSDYAVGDAGALPV